MMSQIRNPSITFQYGWKRYIPTQWKIQRYCYLLLIPVFVIANSTFVSNCLWEVSVTWFVKKLWIVKQAKYVFCFVYIKCCYIYKKLTFHPQKYAESFGIPFLETSSKDAIRVEQAFISLTKEMIKYNATNAKSLIFHT